nr:MAG TPA_asm: hypothetical protein [Caudoviricetes sp.]
MISNQSKLNTFSLFLCKSPVVSNPFPGNPVSEFTTNTLNGGNLFCAQK